MTVRIKHGRFRLAFWLPYSFLKFGVKIALKYAGDADEKITVDKKAVKEIVKALRQAKKFHGKLEIVNVKSADGSLVKVIL